MIVSNDKKYFFIANPKTGTRTALDVLKSHGIYLADHPHVSAAIGMFQMKDPTFDYHAIEKIYVFWRDPVDRFISAVNFLRSARGGPELLRRNREWFPDVEIKDPVIPIRGSGITKIEMTDAILEMLAAITPEQIFNDEMERVSPPHNKQIFHVLQKQGLWLTGSDKMVILDYANFEHNLKLVASDFGIDCANLIVPVLNKSTQLTTSLSPELEARVQEYYFKDYNFQPH